MIFFFSPLKNRLWYFMQIVSLFAWKVNAYFLGKNNKIISKFSVVCWFFYQHAKRLYSCFSDTLHIVLWSNLPQIFGHPLTPYHICPKMKIFLLSIHGYCLNCWMNSKQFRPLSEATLCGVLSGSTFFAQAYRENMAVTSRPVTAVLS